MLNKIVAGFFVIIVASCGTHREAVSFQDDVYYIPGKDKTINTLEGLEEKEVEEKITSVEKEKKENIVNEKDTPAVKSEREFNEMQKKYAEMMNETDSDKNNASSDERFFSRIGSNRKDKDDDKYSTTPYHIDYDFYDDEDYTYTKYDDDDKTEESVWWNTNRIRHIYHRYYPYYYYDYYNWYYPFFRFSIGSGWNWSWWGGYGYDYHYNRYPWWYPRRWYSYHSYRCYNPYYYDHGYNYRYSYRDYNYRSERKSSTHRNPGTTRAINRSSLRKNNQKGNINLRNTRPSGSGTSIRRSGATQNRMTDVSRRTRPSQRISAERRNISFTRPSSRNNIRSTNRSSNTRQSNIRGVRSTSSRSSTGRSSLGRRSISIKNKPIHMYRRSSNTRRPTYNNNTGVQKSPKIRRNTLNRNSISERGYSAPSRSSRSGRFVPSRSVRSKSIRRTPSRSNTPRRSYSTPSRSSGSERFVPSRSRSSRSIQRRSTPSRSNSTPRRSYSTPSRSFSGSGRSSAPSRSRSSGNSRNTRSR